MILKHGQALTRTFIQCDGVHLGKVCKKNFLANSLLKMGSFNILFNKKKHFLDLSSFDEQEVEISPNWF